MKIGNINIENNIFLAPMAGITDMPFRLICKQHGCGLVYSEMVSAKGLYYNSERTKQLLFCVSEERPFVIQIFGSQPDIMAKAVQQIDVLPVDIIDINMGCPAQKIVKNGEGAALMKQPDLAAKIIYSVVSSTAKPVTVKIRKGWDDDFINAVEIAKLAEQNGAQAVTIHGRTRNQFYTGRADWNVIKRIKEYISIPVIGNGDIFSPQDVRHMLEQTKCDAVMIGRGALGNPWIFDRSLHYIKTGQLLPEPSPQQKISKALQHLDAHIKYKGEKIGVIEMRKHISWYIKGIRNSNSIKNLINSVQDRDSMRRILIDFLDTI
ncbi:MAG: tRNA dihydrouridine synthase DusB [Clostridia bacterium]|nr:tRNA dihydrouridine synthase DusB [Clostridia bacterium]